MHKTEINLIPNIINPSPDYYCTWQTQLYATCDGKPPAQRAIISEKALFDTDKPYGWAYFYEKARHDLFIVMDDSWDVPLNGNRAFYGSLELNSEKFPVSTTEKTNSEALKTLTERIKSLGWKGLGGWVCAQEPAFYEGNIEEYWKKCLIEMQESGFSYWKVDWGKKAQNISFRKMLTDLARDLAPNLIIEHAMIPEIISEGDVFRTYDVPAIMSIPMTMQKIMELSGTTAPTGTNQGLINCEDEVYAAAAGGFTMGVMRHPYAGPFVNNLPDPSFPALHRHLKTKMYEVIRATRWHRIAPAFAMDKDHIQVSEEILNDTWKFINKNEEMEEWWFKMPAVCDFMDENTDILTKSAPACICRNTCLPNVKPDENGHKPYCIASRNPNGVYSIVTLGRTLERDYFIPKCNVTVYAEDSDVIGVFGEYDQLIIQTDLTNIKQILMQDLADEYSIDITNEVMISDNQLTIPGHIISKIGTMAQPKEDTSEPGVVIKIII